MKQTAALEQLFQLNPDHNREKYAGKTVEFIYDLGGKLLLLTGQLVVHNWPEFESVDIHYTDRLVPLDLPCTHYIFHLSQAHLRSVVPARKPGSRADFLMEKALSPRQCVKASSDEPIQFVPASNDVWRNARLAPSPVQPVN